MILTSISTKESNFGDSIIRQKYLHRWDFQQFFIFFACWMWLDERRKISGTFVQNVLYISYILPVHEDEINLSFKFSWNGQTLTCMMRFFTQMHVSLFYREYTCMPVVRNLTHPTNHPPSPLRLLTHTPDLLLLHHLLLPHCPPLPNPTSSMRSIGITSTLCLSLCLFVSPLSLSLSVLIHPLIEQAVLNPVAVPPIF